MTATKLLYLEQFDALSCTATVQSVSVAEDDRTDAILDQTCFYPRGGGQDWDMGTVTNGAVRLNVQEVRLDEHGQVHHIGQSQGTLKSGDTVEGAVDAGRRDINTRLHSAGHLLDMAVTRLDLAWIPTKGAHYPHMSKVEYDPNGYDGDLEALKPQLQAKINELLTSDYEHRPVFMPVSEMHTVCRHVPPNIPTNKPARVMLYADDFGIPCGGTHTRTNQQIGEVIITGLRSKKGIIKVDYAVKGINEKQL